MPGLRSAGYLARSEDWERFSENSQSVLDREPALTHFKINPGDAPERS